MRVANSAFGACAVLAILGLWRPAYADPVEDLSRELRTDRDYKVRLSAALNLGKLGDPRAVPALVDALADTDRSVRGVSAAALGRLVNASVPAEVRARAASELERVIAYDADASVRAQALRSLDAVHAIQVTPPQPLPRPLPHGRPVYVAIGDVADPSHVGRPDLMTFMNQEMADGMSRGDPAIVTQWPGSAAPDAATLKRANAAGFYIDASLASLVVQRGTPTRVHCDLSILIATYPQRSIFAFVKGSADVETSSSERAVKEAQQDCLRAVVDDLISTQVVPTLKSKKGEAN